ncbi:NCS2 family permease [Ornithinibacillus contaminans]|uniref:NCS2 family permease n=1 Tax=Ornithinibacillus contaminans TaxID=694055 RepID=UPI00064DFD08|nr:NCS2 family permease [Ornithinibacillus contaminans]
MSNFLNRFFKLNELNTNIKTEVLAGITTFITMAYIIIVQPNLMEAAGMPVGAVMVSTMIVSGLFTIIMGIVTNRPFALAPAMGSNAFFSYSIVAAGLATWQTALGMIFISGVIFLLLTLLGLREAISNMLPKNIKLAISGSVGIFIVGTGLVNGGIIIQREGSNNMTLASLHDPSVLLALIGILVTIGLMARKVKGAVLWGILLVTVLGFPLGITKLPDTLFQLPPDPTPIFFQIDWISALKLSFFPLIFTFFTGDFFSTLGTILGVSEKAGLLDKDGNLPGIKKPFLVDSSATIVGSLMGVTTVTTYVESASGVGEGGKTGLTSISTGLLFWFSLFLTPIFLMIPGVATAPALVVIGILILESLRNINFDKLDELATALILILVTAFSFSIANGIVFGIISYVIIKLITGKVRDIPIGLYFLCIPLAYYLWLI